ncbi:MAG: MBL fold metallo-hydrolase RNA specificity domain-containing protein, partial [Bacillota bacterium]
WEPFRPTPDVEISFQDAGHILGSAMATIKYENNRGKQEKIIFSGDLGRYDHFIVKDPAPIGDADYIVMETTYGNRLHNERHIDVEARRKQLAATIIDTFNQGGNVIIPAFAVDRCQDIIMEINGLIDEGLLPNTKIYVDSPLSVQATEIFSRHPECFDENTRALMKKYGRSPLKTENIVFSTTLEQSIAINNIKSGAIVISASGMAEAGRIKHHLKHNLWRPECTVIFAGYQAEGTLGRRLIEGEKLVKIHGEEIEVKAKIIFMEGYSAHADRDEMIHWLSTAKEPPKAVFLIHGEDDSRAAFAQTVQETYGWKTVIPTWGEVFDLAAKQSIVEVADVIRPQVPQVVLSQLYFDINQKLSALVRDNDIENLQALKDMLDDIAK